MSSYCSNCHRDMGFPGEPDIDIQEISDKLEPGYEWVDICEGCAFHGVAKNESGEILIIEADGQLTKWDPEQDRMEWYYKHREKEESSVSIPIDSL